MNTTESRGDLLAIFGDDQMDQRAGRSCRYTRRRCRCAKRTGSDRMRSGL